MTGLINDTDRAFDARRAGSGGAPISETRPSFVPLDPDPGYVPINDALRQFRSESGAVLAAESPRTLFDLIEAYGQSPLIDAVEGYLGARPAMWVNKCVLRRIVFQSSMAIPWHQDGAFLDKGVRTIDAWLSLSHCGGDTDTAGLEIPPRRMHEVLEPCEQFRNAVTRKQFEVEAAGKTIVRPCSLRAPVALGRDVPAQNGSRSGHDGRATSDGDLVLRAFEVSQDLHPDCAVDIVQS